jgi:hypothetical protein
MRDPAGRGSDEGRNDRRGCNGAPVQARLRQVIKVEPRRHRLVCNRTEARAYCIGLCAPLGNLRSIVWMHSKPGLDGGAAIRRQQAIHIGVKLVSRHRHIAFHHDLIPVI